MLEKKHTTLLGIKCFPTQKQVVACLLCQEHLNKASINSLHAALLVKLVQ